MYKIQTLNTIASIGLNLFPRELYEVATEIQYPDGILVRSHNLHDMIFPDTLKVIGRAGTGVNNIPLEILTKRGIPVLNTPGANANAVRELVIAGMLLASRHICTAWNYVNSLLLTDIELNQHIENNKKKFVGFELMGKTLGVIGLGSVGVKVANAAIALGMKVIGCDPTISVNRAWELSSEVKQAHSVDDVLLDADFVSVHVPLTEDNRNMINHARLHLMKNNVVLLNFSREGIINNSDLITALKENKLHAYVTDFPNAALKNFPQVISLPHLGASTKEAEENCAMMIVKELRDFFEHGTITHSVNFPTIEMSQSRNSIRLAIANINIPNMVAQISAKLAHAGVNILSLLNKSRDDIAYTLIDVNINIDERLIKDIAQIDGILQVRKIDHF